MKTPGKGVHLHATGVTKVYGATRALKGVELRVEPGRVTVLFGENGAGKSTLMKILSGVERPTSGRLELDGEEVEFDSAADAAARGIAIIHQELNLAPNLSIVDNMFMGRELRTRLGAVNTRAQRAKALELLERLDEPQLDPSTLVSELRIGQQQIIEIARALSADARILIMDEPTSALSASEVEVLFRIIRELTARNVAVVYISHHLEEALEISDHAVVFRDGEKVAEADVAEIDLPWVIEQMVGRDVPASSSSAAPAAAEPVLVLERVSVADVSGAGRLAVQNVNLRVRPGEVVCIYGLMGAGRTELLEAIAGKTPVLSGRMRLAGREFGRMSIRERIEAGLGLVPEDRQRDGILPQLSVRENITLARMRDILRAGMIDSGRERSLVERAIAAVHLKTASPESNILSLSGGNQQKAIIARQLSAMPKVLLLDEPTRGIDVGAKGEIFALLFERACAGLGVVFATSEIGEALTASHRIIVMSKGRFVREFDTAACSREDVMAASGEAVDHHIGASS